MLQAACRSSDIFLISRQRFEGMPLALLEAMGAGLCCCVSDVDGMGEAIQHGLNGYLCAPGDVPKWCEQIETIVANPALPASTWGNGPEISRMNTCSIDSMASSTIAIYRDVIRSFPRWDKIA